MTEPWADTPFALITDTGILSQKRIDHDHPAVFIAQQMALAHNIILRSINASFNQCLGVQPGTTEAHDFLLFNRSIFETLKHHHEVEEDYMFVEIEQLTGISGIMDKNIQEHRDFQDGLEEFRKYVFETNADDYDGSKLMVLLEGFGKTVEVHLHNEIPTLLELKDYDASRLMMIDRGMGKRFASVYDKYRHVPLLLGCSDRTFLLDGRNIPFPPVPFFIPYIIRFLFEPRYAGSWRFNPCDSFGQPRPLCFSNPIVDKRN